MSGSGKKGEKCSIRSAQCCSLMAVNNTRLPPAYTHTAVSSSWAQNRKPPAPGCSRGRWRQQKAAATAEVMPWARAGACGAAKQWTAAGGSAAGHPPSPEMEMMRFSVGKPPRMDTARADSGELHAWCRELRAGLQQAGVRDV